MQFYRDLPFNEKESINSVFMQESVEKLKEIDPVTGYDINDTKGYVDALNALPRRKRLQLVERL